MIPIWPSLILLAVAFALTAGLTRLVLVQLLARGIFDRPNARSSHTRPTPRGGGIAVVGLAVLGWAYVGPGPEGEFAHIAVLAATVALALVSWRDDLRGLPVVVRLAAHVAAVAVVLFVGAPGGLWTGALMLGGIGFLWVWFINLFNFMDGIDGITGVETIAIGGGVVVLAATGAADPSLGLKAVVLVGAGAGFLIWNWHPARIFLGDVGSVPLGFLTGWLLLMLGQAGYWPAAVILPLYYVADTGLTLARRALRTEPVWRAHREHAYQRALPPQGGHDRITYAIAGANAGLVGLALLSLTQPLTALLLAAVLVGMLLWHFERQAARPNTKGQG